MFDPDIDDLETIGATALFECEEFISKFFSLDEIMKEFEELLKDSLEVDIIKHLFEEKYNEEKYAQDVNRYLEIIRQDIGEQLNEYATRVEYSMTEKQFTFYSDSNPNGIMDYYYEDTLRSFENVDEYKQYLLDQVAEATTRDNNGFKVDISNYFVEYAIHEDEILTVNTTNLDEHLADVANLVCKRMAVMLVHQ
jgi:hypothetical protein